MSGTAPGFFARLSLALRVLGDATLAQAVQNAAAAPSAAASTPAALPAAPQTPQAEKVVEKIVERRVEVPVEVEKIVEKVVEREVIKEVVREVEKPGGNAQDGALHLLSILQREGRLIDFIHEDVTGFTDAEVGAAARVVHAGVKRSLTSFFTWQPVRSESEGAAVTLPKGFDAHAVRLSGNVRGEPPYKGTLAHAGWRAAQVNLPERPGDVDSSVVAPAEVELS